MNNENFGKCPNEEKLYDYSLQGLSFKERIDIEAHFDLCPECTQKMRAILEALAILACAHSNANMGESFSNSWSDVAVLAAASSEYSEGVAEVKSINGKYSIRLIPFLNSNKSVLEVRIMDKNVKGTLVVEGKYDKIFEAPICDGLAIKEIDSQTDLGFMLIKINNM